MKRITFVISDDLYTRLQHERRRRDVSAAIVVREALEAYLGALDQPRGVPFAALERSGRGDVARRAEEILEQDRQRLRDR